MDQELGPPARLTALELNTPDGGVLRLPLDVLLVRLGLTLRLGPLAEWGLQLERKQLPVDPPPSPPTCPAFTPWATRRTYPGKRKLAWCAAFTQATLAAFSAAEWLAGQPAAAGIHLQQHTATATPGRA